MPRNHVRRPAALSLRQVVTKRRCHWYVDSINGSDAQSGKSPSQAFRTIAALAAVFAEGQRVGLARGSHWREMLTLPGDGCRVEAYGAGELPLLDASGEIAGASWSKTAGYTNIYEYHATIATASANNFCNLWEDDVQMTYYTSLANLDAAGTLPGFYLADMNTTTPMLYIHASGADKNPATNGKVYAFAARPAGVQTSDSLHSSKLVGIWARRGYQKDGTISLGLSSTLIGCRVSDGGQYSVFIRDGCTLESCSILDGHHGTANIYQILYNQNTPSGLGLRVLNCTLGWRSASAPRLASCAVITGHSNVSGTFGTLRVEGCAIGHTAWFFADPRALSAIVSRHNTLQSAQYGYVTPTLTGTGSAIACTVDGDTWLGCKANCRVASVGALLNLTITNLTATLDGVMSTAYFYVTGGSLTMTDSHLNITQTSYYMAVVYCSSASAALALLRNSIRMASINYPFYQWTAGASGMTWASDYNTFDYATQFQMSIFGTTYTSLASYQAAVAPRDANSTGV